MRQRLIRVLLLTWFAMTATQPAVAVADPAAAGPIASLEDFLARSDALSADFRQLLVNGDGSGAEQSSGRFYVKRPGRFRWEYCSSRYNRETRTISSAQCDSGTSM